MLTMDPAYGEDSLSDNKDNDGDEDEKWGQMETRILCQFFIYSPNALGRL